MGISVIDLSPEQQRAHSEFKVWLRGAQRQPFVLLGYAGTGKSTLIQLFADEFGWRDGGVVYVTFTGKAALVLRRKGLEAQTIHSLIYAPILEQYWCERTQQQKERVCGFKLRDPNELHEVGVKLIVIDELSMVSAKLLADLLTFGVPVVAMGDPGQLPPVQAQENMLLKRPNATLTEIHRQAADNPIIWASMRARQGLPIPYGVHGDGRLSVRRWTSAELQHLDTTTFDQVLCCTHRLRRWFNDKERLEAGRGELPEVGETLVCLRNRWEELADDGTPLLNGLKVKVVGTWGLPNYKERTLTLDVETEWGAGFAPLQCELDWFTEASKGKECDTNSKWAHFDFGYALTVHRSQGSEWPAVVVVNDGFGDATLRRKLLYTAVTRASERLWLVQ
jgi:exodeoxyribonuclease-5